MKFKILFLTAILTLSFNFKSKAQNPLCDQYDSTITRCMNQIRSYEGDSYNACLDQIFQNFTLCLSIPDAQMVYDQWQKVNYPYYVNELGQLNARWAKAMGESNLGALYGINGKGQKCMEYLISSYQFYKNAEGMFTFDDQVIEDRYELSSKIAPVNIVLYGNNLGLRNISNRYLREVLFDNGLDFKNWTDYQKTFMVTFSWSSAKQSSSLTLPDSIMDIWGDFYMEDIFTNGEARRALAVNSVDQQFEEFIAMYFDRVNQASGDNYLELAEFYQKALDDKKLLSSMGAVFELTLLKLSQNGYYDLLNELYDKGMCLSKELNDSIMVFHLGTIFEELFHIGDTVVYQKERLACFNLPYTMIVENSMNYFGNRNISLVDLRYLGETIRIYCSYGYFDEVDDLMNRIKQTVMREASNSSWMVENEEARTSLYLQRIYRILAYFYVTETNTETSQLYYKHLMWLKNLEFSYRMIAATNSSYEGFKDQLDELSLKQMKKQLEKNDILMHFTTSGEKIKLAIVTRKGIDFKNLPYKQSDLASDYVISRETHPSSQSKNLYKQLLKYVIDYYEPEKIYLIKDGELRTMNFETFYDEKREQYAIEFIDFYDFSSPFSFVHRYEKLPYVSNGSIIGNPTFSINSKLATTQKKWGLLRGPTDDFGIWTSLEGTHGEMEKVEEIFINQHLTYNYFEKEEANYENLSNMTSTDIIHIATHGFFKDSKEETFNNNGIVLAGVNDVMSDLEVDGRFGNGYLTSKDIQKLDLRDTDLVFLSSCEGALGTGREGQDLYGLPAAFKLSGVSKVIASLWKISDDKTVLISTSFYNDYLETLDVETSLKNAKLKTLRQFPEPKYWGAFIIY